MLKGIVVVVAIFIATPAFSQDYRSEIISHVVEPCLDAKIRGGKLTKHMSYAEAMTIMKLMTKQSMEKSISALMPLVRGKSWDVRSSLYRLSARICANAK